MSNENMTLLIDPETRDIVLDDDGILAVIYGDDTSAQSVRLTLQTWVAEFFADETHGTKYDRILGKKPSELSHDEIAEVYRDAILQERNVAQVDEVTADIADRTANVAFRGRLTSGAPISMEVTT